MGNRDKFYIAFAYPRFKPDMLTEGAGYSVIFVYEDWSRGHCDGGELCCHAPQVLEDMETLRWQEASDIEKILAVVEQMLERMISAFRRCGTFSSGQKGELP